MLFPTSLPSWVFAVIASISASTFSVTGFVIQKRALVDPSGSKWPQFGSIVLSPGWIAGFVITAIFPIIGDLVAYSLAPLSLTAPLCGVSVVLNMVIAPWALSERLQLFPDLPATVAILMGCVVTTVFGNHDETSPFDADDLIRLGTKPVFELSLVVGVVCECFIITKMRANKVEIERQAQDRQDNPYLPHVLLPATAAALCGAVANIGLKAVGELAKAGSPWWKVIFCGLLVAPAAIMQVNYINRGLYLYPQTIFLSVFDAMLVLLNTVYGALFYQEYTSLLRSTWRFFVFCCGCYLIMQGIWLFRLRGRVKGNQDEKDFAIPMPHLSATDRRLREPFIGAPFLCDLSEAGV